MKPGKFLQALRAREETCSRGHAMTGKNVYVPAPGKRYCRQCYELSQQARASFQEDGRTP